MPRIYPSGGNHLKRTVVVAVVAMLVVKATVDQIVYVIAMGDGFVAAAGAVHVGVIMTEGIPDRMATIRICRADLDDMLINVIAMRVMQMTVVKIIDMIAMLDGGMAAAGAMLVIVVFMMREIAVCHGYSFLTQWCSQAWSIAFATSAKTW